MAGLKAFRVIPANIREWTRWMRAQDIPTVDADTVGAVQTQYPANSLVLTGVGTPEGNITAPVPTVYLRSDGGTNTTLYVKESGSGNTGWAAI